MSMASTLALILLLHVVVQSGAAVGAPQVPCFFIFGNSLEDNGNNNDLRTLSKVNYLPYGIDFPEGPTGRFTNGRNVADFLAKFLGFDNYIPPFAKAQDKDIESGVNYASGSAGIRNETGRIVGDRISLDRQLANHKTTTSRIAELRGNETSAKEHLNKCLYYFEVGNNDYLNNYFRPEFYNSSTIYTPKQYASLLVQQYSTQLKTLHGLGARKVSVSGLGPLGCIPAMLARGTNGSACVDLMNDAVKLFNNKLKRLVKELNRDLTDSKFVYIKAMDLSPRRLFDFGISVLSRPCCQVSNVTGLCIPGGSLCPNRASHLFFDSYHPTEIVNAIAAASSYFDILKLIY